MPKYTQSHFEIDIAMPGLDIHIWIERFHRLGRRLGFAPSAIRFPKQYRATQITVFDDVEVGYENVSNAH